MKTILRLILCTLLPLHVAVSADRPPSVAGRWEVKKVGEEALTSMLTLEPDGIFRITSRKPNESEPSYDWSGKYTFKGEILALVFTPKNATRSHAPLKFKWDKESDTPSALSRVDTDGVEREAAASDKLIRYETL